MHGYRRPREQCCAKAQQASRLVFLDWLEEYCDKHQIEILAYGLLSNPPHLVAIPDTEEGRQRVWKPLHRRYAQRLNRLHGCKGHVW